MARHHRQLLATLSLAGVCTVCSVRAEDPRPNAAAIESLVPKLGSAAYSEREAAARNLEAAGADALAPLRKAAQSEDAEIRRRAESLVEEIEKRVEAARILQSRMIRLKYREVPLGEALADLSRQTGIQVQLPARPKEELLNRRITLDTGEVGIWEALDRFCKAAGLVEQQLVSPNPPSKQEVQVDNIPPAWNAPVRRQLIISSSQPNPMPSKLTLIEGVLPVLPSCSTGPVRVRSLPSNFINATASGGDRVFALEVIADASVIWLDFDNLRIEKAVNNHGQTLEPQYEFPSASSVGATAELVWLEAAQELRNTGVAPFHVLKGRLQDGPERSSSLRKLSGTISAHVQTPSEPLLTMEKVLSAAGKTIRGDDGYLMEIRDVSYADNGELSMRVAVQQPLTAAPQIGRGWGNRGFRGRMVSSSSGTGGPENFTLIDGDDKPLTVIRHQSSITHLGESLSQETTLVCRVSKSRAETARLVFSGPRNIIIQVPFTLKDVPLK